MSLVINAEHFELSPELRTKLELKLEKILSIIPAGSLLKLFLKKESRGQFAATLLVHFDHKDISCTERGWDILGISVASKNRLVRMLVSQKERRLGRRKAG